jgi:hypothetical protein
MESCSYFGGSLFGCVNHSNARGLDCCGEIGVEGKMYETNAHGLTMKWLISRSTPFNAANPFKISGYINGECRMSNAITARTAGSFKECEKRVISRLAEISKEISK